MSTSWQKRPLGDLLSTDIDYRGKTPPKSDAGIPTISAANVKGGRVIFDGESFVSRETYEEWLTRGEPKPDDVLITTEAPVGEVALFPPGGPYLPTRRVIALRGKKGELDNRFLKYSLQYDGNQRRLQSNSRGSTVSRVLKDDIFGLEINVPPLPIQRRIADILGALDDKIALNRQMNETLEAMAQALYRHWFVDFGPFQDKPFVDSELGPIPEGWEVKPAYDLCDVLTGGTPKTKVDEYWGTDIYWISAKDISDTETFALDTERKITPLGLEESSTEILPERTAVVVARGSAGKHCMIGREMAMNQSCYGLRGREGVGQCWTFLMLSNLVRRLQQVAYGSVFDTITISTFKNTDIVAPPIEVLQEFERKVEYLFDLMHSNALENETLAETRDYLLPRLISGEIEVEAAEERVGSAAA